MFKELQDAIQWVEKQTKFKPKTDLTRMQKAYDMLNIDLTHIKKIHVAGTNGKGTTLEFIMRILRVNNQKVGAFRSPYVLTFNERLSIGKEHISDDALLVYINEIYTLNQAFKDKYQEHLSFFELLTLMAFKYFYDQKVDFMVIEVGLGGLLDATNILNYDLSVITNIGYDHMHILGNSLESIAKNKLGIVKKGNHLITIEDETVKQQFIDHCKHVDASLKFVKPLKIVETEPLRLQYNQRDIFVSAKGAFNAKNAALAIEAVKYFYPNLTHEQLKLAFRYSKVIGRFMALSQNLYVDGAHNVSAMKALVDHLKAIKGNRTIKIIFSALGDKDINGMLDLLEEVSNHICITSFPDPRFKSLKSYVRPGMLYNEDGLSAIHHYYKQRDVDEIVVITGSFHFIGYMMNTYKDYLLKKFKAEEDADRIEDNPSYYAKDIFEDEK